MYWILKLRKNTRPSGTSSRTHISGPEKIAWPNGVRPLMELPDTLIASPPAAR